MIKCFPSPHQNLHQERTMHVLLKWCIWHRSRCPSAELAKWKKEVPHMRHSWGPGERPRRTCLVWTRCGERRKQLRLSSSQWLLRKNLGLELPLLYVSFNERQKFRVIFIRQEISKSATNSKLKGLRASKMLLWIASLWVLKCSVYCALSIPLSI